MRVLLKSDGSPTTIWEARRAYRIAGEIAASLQMQIPCRVIPTNVDPYLWLSDVQGSPAQINDVLSFGILCEKLFMGEVFWPEGAPFTPEFQFSIMMESTQIASKMRKTVWDIAQLIVVSPRGLTERRIKLVVSKTGR